MPMGKEPVITINGHTLTLGEAMTVRVAIGSFILSLQEEGLGDDPHGKFMTDAYMDRCRDIYIKMRIL